MEETPKDTEDSKSISSNSSSDESDVNGALTSGNDDELHLEEPLTEKEVDELIGEFLEVESKAAEAQETLEMESLAKVEAEVRQELAQNFQGDELEAAVADEMNTFREEWEAVLDDLETESTNLLEQLDGAGVELPSLYRMIESQAPNGCSTESWKKMIHWVGSQVTSEVKESISDADKYLQAHRPVRRKHGKILEEGASGFLQKKLASESDGSRETVAESSEVEWSSMNQIFSDGVSKGDTNIGSKDWASVYLASTPQEAATMGLSFPGVDEVEEIDDIDGTASDPFVKAALENEKDLVLLEKQKNHFRKVKEEDDANLDRKLQLRLKRRRQRKKLKQPTRKEGECKEDLVLNDQSDAELDHKNDSQGVPGNEKEGTPNFLTPNNLGSTGAPNFDNEEPPSDAVLNCNEARGSKRSNELEEENAPNKKGRSEFEKAMDSGELVDSTSDSDSDTSDSDSDNSNADNSIAMSNKRKQKKNIRRILDDAELGEETKRKIAIEKERQQRLNSLKVQFSVKSFTSCNGTLPEDASTEVLGDASRGYIVNVVREKGEEAVRIPPSISEKLKVHQVAGIRFMWENIIQSISKVKSGDKGLGCILAHTMGLGKTLQVIAFLYAAMRCVDLGLRTALIVTPVNVLHNWRHEFLKWRPSEVKPLRVFMLEDVTRERRSELLAKWRTKGGVFLIGYAAFRNLSLGKHVKDRHVAREICCALQNGPDILVCDEAHMIKNTRADTTQALKQIKCQRRIALTGSPLQNNLMEYFCMVDFVREGFLGSSHEFRNRFQNPIENGQHTNSTSVDVKIMNQRSHILYEQLKGFVQRMDMSVVKKDLPPKTVYVVAVKLSPLQRKLYKRFLDVHGFTNDRVSVEGVRKSFFAGYQALAQIWNHPGILQLRREERDCAKRLDTVDNCLADDSSSDDIVDDTVVLGDKSKNGNSVFFRKDWWNDLLDENEYKELEYSGKMVLLLDILTASSKVGDKALVFSQSIPTLDLIELYLSKLSRYNKRGKFWKKHKDWYRLDGRTESAERQRLVEKFNDPANKRVKCVLISTRAGSLGINLYAANRVVIVDGSWNPTYDLQAIYRAWRYGQKKPVFAYRLMAHGTMEEKIYKRQVNKESLAARVVDKQQVHRTISKEEMLHLFEFGDEENPDTSCDLVQDATSNNGVSLKQKAPISHGSCSSDKIMESLLSKHHPRWIANYHEHETLLQENEEEKLSKEEQDMAWEVYIKSLEWEEVQRGPVDGSVSDRKTIATNENHHAEPSAPLPENRPVQPSAPLHENHPASLIDHVDSGVHPSQMFRPRSRHRSNTAPRKCTNLSHLLTLRSQGTKTGCTTVCGECAEEISWERLNRSGRTSF